MKIAELFRQMAQLDESQGDQMKRRAMKRHSESTALQQQKTEVQELLEARIPHLSYTETVTKGKLSRVVLSLEGSNSASVTKLAKRYERLDKTALLLKKKRDEVNEAIKEFGDELFDAEDALATRIIETVSFTMMLTAAEKAEQKKPTPKTDFEAAFAELSKLVPELEEKALEILKKYTELVPPKDTPVKLQVKSKLKEGLVGAMKAGWERFVDTIRSWGASYDKRLDALKKKFGY